MQGTVNGTSITASSVVDGGAAKALVSGSDHGNGAPKGGMGRFFGAVGGFFTHLFGFFWLNFLRAAKRKCPWE